MPTATRQKRAYTRPCDACAARRVRCDRELRPDRQCSSCSAHGAVCTNNRVRLKSGPKRIHSKTREHIQHIQEQQQDQDQDQHQHQQHHDTCEPSPVTLTDLRPYLEVFRVRYYGIWPVLSVDDCLDLLTQHTVRVGQTEFLVLDHESAPTYALCCSVCAVVARHTTFWTTEEFEGVHHLGLNRCPPPERYVAEAERALYDYHLDGTPSVDLVLTHFFLHVYFSSLEKDKPQELVYLRQAISCAQLLCLFDRTTLFERPQMDAHRIKKIYYLLLITERYVSFKTRLPVMLDPSMPLPSMEDDEHPEVLRGFIELAQVFSAADNNFFNEVSTRGKLNNFITPIDIFDFDKADQSAFKRDWLRSVQSKLGRAMVQVRNHSQKLNILISRTWLQSIAWSLSNDQLLLTPTGRRDDCFDIRYPLHIAADFLIQANDIPNDAFESNGPGAVLKLLELAYALHSYIQISPALSNDTSFAYDQLAHLHGMILRHRSDITMPIAFDKVTDLLEVKRFGFRHIGMDTSGTGSTGSTSSKIEELVDNIDDDHDNEQDIDGQERLQRVSPMDLAQIVDAFMSSPPEQMSLTPFLKEFEFPLMSVNDDVGSTRSV